MRMLEGSYYSLYYLRYVRPHAGMSWSGINVVLARVYYTLAGRVCNNTRQHSCTLMSRIQALIILISGVTNLKLDVLANVLL